MTQGHWWRAVADGDVDAMDELHATGVDVDSINSCHDTALVVASRLGNMPIVHWLVHHGATINHSNLYGNTPLMIAAFRHHHDIMSVLLSKGAEPRARNDLSTPVLTFAAGSLPAVRLLLNTPARRDANTADQHGVTPLMQAMDLSHVPASARRLDMSDRQQIIRLLVRYGANPNAQDMFGTTPLMIAASHDALPLVETLMSCGASTSIMPRPGQSAVDMAHHPAVIRRLMHQDNVYVLSKKVHDLHHTPRPAPAPPTAPLCA